MSTKNYKGEMVMETSRRSFLVNGLSVGALALATNCPAAEDVRAEDRWKTVFRMMGFDPDAEGCGVFAVVGDPHVTNNPTATLRAAIRAWNTMSPRPMFALSVGDQLCGISGQFGDREWPSDPKWKAACDKEIADFQKVIEPCKIPFKHIIGNHDTYPDERDARFYASHFPGWRPYERMDACGVQFLFLNSGHDGWIDPVQERWIAEEVKKLDPARAVVLAVHQPGMLRHRENGIPRMIRRVFDGWKGELWVLGGHEHHNAFAKYHLPNGTPVAVATHVRAVFGYWLYGVRRGSIAARLFVQADGLVLREFGPFVGAFSGWKVPRPELMPADLLDRGLLPVPFENTKGVLWKILVGEDDDKRKYRVDFFPQSDAGHWYFYIGRTTYRLPLKDALGATHAAFLGSLLHHRETGEHEKVYLSTDNENWTRCEEVLPEDDVYAYPIPESMRTAEWLYLRVDGFEFDCDSCIAGYALICGK